MKMTKKIIFKYGKHWLGDLQLVAERLNEVIDEMDLVKKNIADLQKKLGIEVPVKE